MDKIISVFKPVGFSTYDVIRVFKRKTGFRGKIGHAGTLDPFAVGVVLLLLGAATKRFEEVRSWEKVYSAGIRLGAASTTGDVEGEITPGLTTKRPQARAQSGTQEKPTKEEQGKPTKKEIEEVLKGFVGETAQKIPAFSAAKHKGVPLYKLARQGKVIEKSKQVNISKIELLNYKYPLLTIRVFCSSGTYIRQLAEDIGLTLKTGAFLYYLLRERIGRFSLKDCCSVDDFSPKPRRRLWKPTAAESG